jgi:hypothetical protein
MTPDADRRQVYAAELAAFDGTDLESVVGFDTVRQAIDSVVAGEWWSGPSVLVKASRGDAHSSVTRCGPGDGAVPEIRIAPPQATIATGAHELAHALAGVAHGHDRVFRRAHLDVVQAMTNLNRIDGRGLVHVAQLEGAYSAVSLTVGARAWPAPPKPGGAIAL